MGPNRSTPSSALRWSLVPLLLLLAARGNAQSPPKWTESILGQEEQPTEPAKGEALEKIKTERDAIDAEIEALRSLEAEPSPATSEPTDDVSEASLRQAKQLRLLEKTRSLLGRQIDELERAEALQQEAKELEAMDQQGVSAVVEHEPPFGFDDLDAVLVRLDAAKSRRAMLEDTVAAGAETVDEAEKRLRRTEQERRQARNRAEGASAANQGRTEDVLGAEQRAARLAQAEVTQLHLQQDNDRRELELTTKREAFEQRGADWIRTQLAPSQEALQARLDGLTAEQDELRQRLEQLGRDTQREESRLLRAQAAARGDEAEVAGQALDLLDQRQRLLDDGIDRRDLEAELWRLRYRWVAKPTADAETRSRNRDIASRHRAELERDRRLLTAHLQDLRRAETLTAESLLEIPATANTESQRRRQKLLEDQITFVKGELSDIETALSLARRVEAEMSVESFHADELAAGLWRRVRSIWQWEITVVEDRSITLGKVILAMLLLIAGYLASKRISHAFGRVLQRRFGLSGGAAAALQNIAFYLMVVAFVLWSMQLVSIPLTVFTLLGGVLAIGIGFGSQNVVNNFISGLILLVERPVKVGDLIEVDGTVGSVERIGLRSTRVRSGDNTHIIVPNSTFLEQKVLNWTVTDDLVRTQVDVGIAYGSPTRKAEALMKQALDEEPLVVSNMPREILFRDFADNALLFRAHFWIRVKGQLDKARAESALRFRIDELFAKAGITIAFPQRDVHLDTLSPLQVRLLGREESAATKRPE